MIVLVSDARAQWEELDRRIAAFDAEFVRWVKENEEARRLTTIPGIGAIVASAFVAAVGRAESFDRGRDLAAWLGLSRDSSPPEASRSCSGSASAATNISASS
jgi:transposase